LILVEGGPRLFGQLFARRVVDEQFLTLAPQLAGRDDAGERPGLVMGRTFAPRDPRWGRLVDLRRGGHHLFLRYAYSVAGPSASPSLARHSERGSSAACRSGSSWALRCSASHWSCSCTEPTLRA